MWSINYNLDEMSIIIEPVRDTQAHFNITELLLPPDCDDCLEISIISFDTDTRILEADVTLRNPTNLTGYDVRGILYTDEAGHELLGAFGWTSLWDIPGGESINPFKAFPMSTTDTAFTPNDECTIPYYVIIPVPPQWGEIKFAIDASWPDNCKEPYAVGPFFYPTPFNIYHEQGSKLFIRVFVGDWQGDVDEVFFSAPEFTGEDVTPLESYEYGSWVLELTNIETPDFGDYRFTVTATSENSNDLAMYNVWEVSPRRGWARDFGLALLNQKMKITTDNSGNAYVAGDFKMFSDFDPTPYEDRRLEPSSGGVFLTRYDGLGNYQWALTWYTGAVHSMDTDSAGNIYITGYFEDWGDFDPGEGEDMQESNGGYDAYLMKIDPSGEVDWYCYWGGESRDDGIGVAVDGADNVYIAGTFMGTVDFDPGPGTDEHTSFDYEGDAYVCKYNSIGEYQWVQTWGGDDWDLITELDADDSGDVCILGRFSGTVDFDPGPEAEERTSNGVWDISLSKFNENGEFQWVETWGAEGSDVGMQVALDDTGCVYVSGGFEGTIDFDPGDGIDEHISNGEEDAFLAKLDSAGDYQWALTWGAAGDDKANGVDIDNNGDVYVGGKFHGTVDLDPGAGVDEHDPIWSPHAFVSKFSPDGEYLWGRDWGDATCCGSFVRCYDISVCGEGNIYATGEYDGLKVDFDPGVGVDYHSIGTSAGCGGELFVCKFPPDGAW